MVFHSKYCYYLLHSEYWYFIRNIAIIYYTPNIGKLTGMEELMAQIYAVYIIVVAVVE